MAPGDPDLDDRLPAPVPVGSDSGRLSLQVDKPPSKKGKIYCLITQSLIWVFTNTTDLNSLKPANKQY